MPPKTLQIRNSTAEFLIFTKQAGENGKSSESWIEVPRFNGTIWLSQKLMATLFDCSADNISLHLKSIYAEGELSESATAEDFSVVQQEGSREVQRMVKHYNLDAIIAQLAKEFAESEFEKYRIIQDRLFESDFDKEIKGKRRKE
jgi:hypothetical protein